MTGAAFTLFFVNTPAAVHGSEEKIRPKSFSLFFFIPDEIPEKRKPGTPSLAGKAFIC
jgi:hypothetical protein